jgi:hypothetical protein
MKAAHAKEAVEAELKASETAAATISKVTKPLY